MKAILAREGRKQYKEMSNLTSLGASARAPSRTQITISRVVNKVQKYIQELKTSYCKKGQST
jgi:hypothetical protein